MHGNRKATETLNRISFQLKKKVEFIQHLYTNIHSLKHAHAHTHAHASVIGVYSIRYILRLHSRHNVVKLGVFIRQT